jgi:hypothetical protein
MESYHDLSTPPGSHVEYLTKTIHYQTCTRMAFSTLSMCMAAIMTPAAASQGIACMACGISSL